MPDATITSTESTFGTITGTFAADQSTVAGTVTGIITGTLSGSVGVPGPQGPQGVPGNPGQGVPVGGTAGQFLTKIDGTNYNTDWTTVNLSAYAVKANNLSDLTNFATARDNLGLGTLNSPTFAGITAQGSGANVANLTPTSLSLTHATSGSFTIQPSSGITFPDASVQTTAFTTSQLTAYLAKASNLSDLASTSTARTNLGLGSLAVVNDAPSDGSQYARKNAAWDVVISGDRYLTTSTTSLTINNGNKTLTVGTGLSYTPTQNVTISYDAAHHMHGEVLTYNSGTGVMTVDVNHNTGSGTYASWVVNVGGVTPATSVAWGAITGTLSSQTDLQNALNAKLESGSPSATGSLTITGAFTLLTASSGLLKYTHTTLPEETRLRHDSFTLYADGSIDDKMVEISMTGITLYDPGVPGSGATIVFPDGTTQTTAFQGLGGVALLSGATFSGKVNFTPSATSAGLNIGTLATTPSTLSNGDLWIGDNLNYRNQSGATRTVINAQTPNTITVTGANAPLTLNQNGAGSTFLVNAAVASTSPAVKITNNGTGDSLQIDNGTPDVAFTVNADGRVGVGTAPDATAAIKLDAGGIKFNDGTTQTTAPIADAPSDGTVYGRQNGSWVNAETDQVNVQTFGGPSSSGTFTWTKPVGAKWVEVLMIGAGGGGGSGARYATSSARYGGGGGGGGSVLFVRVHADDLASTETVTVGAGGPGGAATTTNAQPGTTGTSGTDSSFGPYFASGGPGGNRGTTSAAAAVGSRFVLAYAFAGSVGNGGAGSGAASSTLTYQYLVAPSGGGGGASALASSTTDADGGAGGGKAAGTSTLLGLISAVSGGAGGIASLSTAPTNGVATSGLAGGTGGGGGYYKTAVIGTAGGNGAFPGGGGGGGGASDNGFNSGAGGNGGNAFIVITTYCV
jgi:hypothetical protein